MEPKKDTLWEEAKMRVEFRNHIVIFVVINALLVGINLMTSPDSLWFYWVTIFWGFGLLMHWLEAYHFKTAGSIEKEYKKLKSEREN